MKKLIALFAIAGCLTFGMSNVVMAQEQNAPANDADQVDAEEEDKAAAAEAATTEEEVVEVSKHFNQVLKDKFIEGGPGWMTPILIVLILGLALVIERTIYLNLATTNTKKLLEDLLQVSSTRDCSATTTTLTISRRRLFPMVACRRHGLRPTCPGWPSVSQWPPRWDSWALLSVWCRHLITSKKRVTSPRPLWLAV